MMRSRGLIRLAPVRPSANGPSRGENKPTLDGEQNDQQQQHSPFGEPDLGLLWNDRAPRRGGRRLAPGGGRHHGRHFAGDVANALVEGRPLAEAIATATAPWMGWTIGHATARETSIPQYLRGNKLSAGAWDSYEEIVDVCAEAWNWLMEDPHRMRSIGTREWATVNV